MKMIKKKLTPKILLQGYPKIWRTWFYDIVRYPKDVDEIANSVDPDQTASV